MTILKTAARETKKVQACWNSNYDLCDTGAALFAGIRCVFNRNNLAFISSFRGFNIGNSCICHFIFIFPGYNTNKFNDQLPVTWHGLPTQIS